jgi:hypothetical protein
MLYSSMDPQIPTELQAALEFQDLIEKSYKPIESISANLLSLHDTLASQVQEAIEPPITAFIALFAEALASENYQQQLLTIENSLNSFASSFTEITIHQNYVSVPESLIPDDFLYEEVANDSTDDDDEDTGVTVVVKKLSFSDALTIIQMLFGLLAWIISFIQTNQSALEEKKNHDEQIAIETEASRIQNEQNQILQRQVDAIKKQTDYLAAIYNKIEEVGSVSPELDSLSPGTDSTPLNSASPSQCADSYQSIEADEPGDSNTIRKAD